MDMEPRRFLGDFLWFGLTDRAKNRGSSRSRRALSDTWP